MRLTDARTYLLVGGIFLGMGLVGIAQHYVALESLRDAFRRVPADVMAQIRETLGKQEWT